MNNYAVLIHIIVIIVIIVISYILTIKFYELMEMDLKKILTGFISLLSTQEFLQEFLCKENFRKFSFNHK